MLRRREISVGYDTLNIKASCKEDAEEIALDTLNFIAENCMPIYNMQIIEVTKVNNVDNKKNDFDVKVMYEIDGKIKKEKEKNLYYGPKKMPIK